MLILITLPNKTLEKKSSKSFTVSFPPSNTIRSEQCNLKQSSCS